MPLGGFIAPPVMLPPPQVRHVAAAALLWASGRHDLPPRLRLPLGGLLVAAAYEGFLTGWAGLQGGGATKGEGL